MAQSFTEVTSQVTPDAVSSLARMFMFWVAEFNPDDVSGRAKGTLAGTTVIE